MANWLSFVWVRTRAATNDYTLKFSRWRICVVLTNRCSPTEDPGSNCQFQKLLTPARLILCVVIKWYWKTNPTSREELTPYKVALWLHSEVQRAMLPSLLIWQDEFLSELRPREVTLAAACTLISLRRQMLLSQRLRLQHKFGSVADQQGLGRLARGVPGWLECSTAGR